MECAATHQAMRNLCRLIARSRGRAMGSEIAGGRDEDRRCLRVALPGEILPRGGLQILHHVKSGILAQKRVAEERNEFRASPALGKMAGGKPRRLRDLLLAIAGIEERIAKLRRRKLCAVIAARQAGRRHIEVSREIDRERAMDSGS